MKRKDRRFHVLRSAVVAAAVGLGLIPAARGQVVTYTWNGGASPDMGWYNPANWVGNVAPPGNTEEYNALFTGNQGLAPARGFAELIRTLTFAADAGGAFEIDNAFDPWVIFLTGEIQSNNAFHNYIDPVVHLNNASLGLNKGITVATGGTLSMSRILGEGFGIIKRGGGHLVIDTEFGTEYTGDTILNGGTVTLRQDFNADALQTVYFGEASTFPFSTAASSLRLESGATTPYVLVRTNSAAANQIEIADGKSFTVNGSLLVGPNVAGVASSGVNTVLRVSGGGSLLMNCNAPQALGVGQPRGNADAGTDPTATLDLSGLGEFRFSGTGEVRVGWGGNVGGTLTLSNTSNTINTPFVRVGDTNGLNGGATSHLRLGGAVNTIGANDIWIGLGRAAGSISFQSGSGSLTITGQNGAGRTNIAMGVAYTGTAGSSPSNLLLAGHPVNVQAGLVRAGMLDGATGGVAAANITFDTGTFNVNNLHLGTSASGTSANGAAGTFTLGGAVPNDSATGVLIVNSQMYLTNRSNASGGPATGALIINGGTADIRTNITDNSTTGTRNPILRLSGGTLIMNGFAIGSAAKPINVALPAAGQTATLRQLGGTGINGAGLNMNGGGTLILAGTNTYSGTTSVSSGTLKINGSVAGPVNVGSGGFIGGVGTYSALSVGAGGTVAPGNSIGTITVGSLSLNGAALGFEIGDGSADRVVVTATGGLTLSGVSAFSFTQLGTLSAGTYTLIDYAGAALPDLSAFNLLTAGIGSFTFALFNNQPGTSVDLTVTAAAVVGTWNVDADGNWADAANWSGGVPDAADATANLGSVITQPRTVTLAGPQKVGVVNFDNANRYTVAGPGTLTLEATTGAAELNVLAGSHTVAVPVRFDSPTAVTVPAGAVLSLTGAAISAASLATVTKSGAGVLELTHLRGGAALAIDHGTVKLAPGATAQAPAGATTVASLAIAGNAAPTAALDVANNALIVDYGGISPAEALIPQILAGRAGGAWNGFGIHSSTAAAGGGPATALGYAEASALGVSQFAGQPVDGTSFIIAFTLAGDVNLDKSVQIGDFAALAANFNAAGGWAQGDFDYSGSTGIADFSLLASNFNQSLPAPMPASAATAVPEPSATALVLAGLAAGGSRRVRRRGG